MFCRRRLRRAGSSLSTLSWGWATGLSTARRRRAKVHLLILACYGFVNELGFQVEWNVAVINAFAKKVCISKLIKYKNFSIQACSCACMYIYVYAPMYTHIFIANIFAIFTPCL